jgi:phosphatidylglycerol:prolipoprotein diacylglycerol transferase
MTGNIIRTDPVVSLAQREVGNTGLALVHPCFLYESMWCLVGLIVLHFYIKKWRSFDGEVFLLYVMWYGLGRAWIEPLRLDSLTAGGFRISQVLAIASAVFALGLFIYAKRGKHVMFKDTEESSSAVETHQYAVKLEREKNRAKAIVSRTMREINDPFAQRIVDEDDEDEEDDD